MAATRFEDLIVKAENYIAVDPLKGIALAILALAVAIAGGSRKGGDPHDISGEPDIPGGNRP